MSKYCSPPTCPLIHTFLLSVLWSTQSSHLSCAPYCPPTSLWFIQFFHQRWESAILVRNSAISQYCGQPKRLRNCGLKKVSELWLRTFNIWLPQFRNSLQSSASSATFLSLFLSSGRFKKSTKNNFWIVYFFGNQKLVLKGQQHENFWPQNFFMNRPPYGFLIHTHLGYHTPPF